MYIYADGCMDGQTDDMTEYKKYKKLFVALCMYSIWKLNSVSIYPLVFSVEGVVTELSKMSGEYGFNDKHLKSGAKRQSVTNVSFSMQIHRAHLLILERIG
jgi:hypothetical protein